MNQKLDCILLIDDDKATNFLNKRLLTKMDVTENIQIARNGIEAIDYIKNAIAGDPAHPWPDMILLDINMPMVNGWEFLDEYEQMPASVRESTIILMLTTSLKREDQDKAESKSTVKGYIKKPLTQAEIERIITTHFNQKMQEIS